MEGMALMEIILLGVGLLFMPLVESSVNTSQTCEIPVMESLTVQENFSLERFMGHWYRINFLIDRWDEVTGEPLVGTDFSFNFWLENYDDSGKPWVNFTVSGRVVPGAATCFLGGLDSYLNITSLPGKLVMYRVDRGRRGTGTETCGINSVFRPDDFWIGWDTYTNCKFSKDFWILMTNYDDYALVYACHKTDSEGRCESDATYIYVLSRRTSLKLDHRRDVDGVIETLCLDMSRYHTYTFDHPCDGGTSHIISLLLLVALVMLTFAAK